MNINTLFKDIKQIIAYQEPKHEKTNDKFTCDICHGEAPETWGGYYTVFENNTPKEIHGCVPCLDNRRKLSMYYLRNTDPSVYEGITYKEWKSYFFGSVGWVSRINGDDWFNISTLLEKAFDRCSFGEGVIQPIAIGLDAANFFVNPTVDFYSIWDKFVTELHQEIVFLNDKLTTNGTVCGTEVINITQTEYAKNNEPISKGNGCTIGKSICQGLILYIKHRGMTDFNEYPAPKMFSSDIKDVVDVVPINTTRIFVCFNGMKINENLDLQIIK